MKLSFPVFGRLRHSLHIFLLVWLVVPMAAILALSLLVSYGNASRQAGLVTDQLLIASARVIAEQIRFGNGDIEVSIPPAALELFASQSRDRAVYRILDDKSRLVAGYDDLAVPNMKGGTIGPIYFNTKFRAEDMRAVAMSQPVVTPNGTISALVVVGETLKGQDTFMRSIWIWDFLQQALLVIFAAMLIWVGISRGLRPLLRLSNAVADRRPDNFEPLLIGSVQTEIRPLLAALNDFMSRLEKQVTRQRNFLDDAAHQLRTPLTILKTQLGYALKSLDTTEKNETLNAADGTVNVMTRLTNQLLVLARAEHDKASIEMESIDFSGVALDVVSKAVPRAVAADIELVILTDGSRWATADAVLAGEMFSNLIDNAILYAGKGAIVTISVSGNHHTVVASVEDNGPGLSVVERHSAFRRFQRGKDANGTGCGLGLAIVAEIAELFGGSAQLSESNSGGLLVTIQLPATTAL